MDRQTKLSVEESAPLWVHRVAHTVEAAATANGLQVAFRQIETATGPVISIILGPPPPIDVEAAVVL